VQPGLRPHRGPATPFYEGAVRHQRGHQITMKDDLAMALNKVWRPVRPPQSIPFAASAAAAYSEIVSGQEADDVGQIIARMIKYSFICNQDRLVLLVDPQGVHGVS
jgi:hypothetical protein